MSNPTLKTVSKALEQLTKQLTEMSKKLDVVVANAGGKTKRKKQRDPNAPKKSKNGYMFYCQENRERVKKANSGIDGKEIVRILSKEWNNLTDKKKSPYQKMAAKDNVRYQKEQAKYVASQTATSS